MLVQYSICFLIGFKKKIYICIYSLSGDESMVAPYLLEDIFFCPGPGHKALDFILYDSIWAQTYIVSSKQGLDILSFDSLDNFMQK